MSATPGNTSSGGGGSSRLTTRTSLPRCRSAYAIASDEPMASPSGRACDATTKRCRCRIASATCRVVAFASSALVSRRCGGSCRRCCAASSSCRSRRICSMRSWWPIDSSNRNSSSGTRRSCSRRRPGGGRTALRAPAPWRCPRARLLVAHRRVVDARQLQIGRDLHPRQGDEADAGIVHGAAAEQLAQLLANLVADAIRTMSLRHYLRNSISVPRHQIPARRGRSRRPPPPAIVRRDRRSSRWPRCRASRAARDPDARPRRRRR